MAAIEHVPVVGEPSKHAHERAVVIFDCETGRRIGHSPHVKVEQTKYTKRDGVITTTLKITHLRDAQCS